MKELENITYEGIVFTSKRITRSYLDFLKSIDDTEQYILLNNDYNACLALFRHSLCCLLGLDSVLSFKELQPIVEDCMKFLSKTYNFKRTTYGEEALLQSCVHCIGFAKSHAEGR